MTRKMKDSGVEWIGMIPDGWTLGRIGELYSERNQKVSDVDYPPLSVTMQGVLPQLANVAKTDAHDDRKLVRCGDFAINSRSDRRGSCGIADRDGSVSLINTVLCPRNEMNPRYYNWLFHTTMFADEFYKWGHGIVDDLWTTRWADMKQMSVPCPSLSEQKRIAEYLDAKCAVIDDVIAKTTESIEEYKKLKQAVITEAVTKGVRGKRLMKDSGIDYLGVMPLEWNIAKISRIFEFIGGFAYKSDRFISDTSFQVLRIGNVKNDLLLLDSKSAFISEEYAKESFGAKVQKDDILFTMTGTKGKQDYFYTLILTEKHLKDKSLYINQRVGCFRQRNSEICCRYYNYLLKQKSIKDYIFLYETGTANQGNLGIETISRTKLYMPSLDEQCEIADYLDSKCAAIDTLISKKQKFIDELTAYKKSLIYEYITGKKEVPA